MNTETQTKPTVHYVGPAEVIGDHAFLVPVDHECLDGQDVTNWQPARTSTVVSHDPKTGRIETRNTIYLPLEI